MAGSSLPDSTSVRPPVASVVVKSTTVAPTVEHGASSLTSSAIPYSPAPHRDITSGLMVASGAVYTVGSHSYVSSTRELSRAIMLPIGYINLFVGFVGGVDASDSPGPRRFLRLTRPVL